ncbi:MAG: UDP-N-acetylmuramoyl-tripeptide--D-alanyl-D-alanine ligase [Gammaproteobacteria bacterium]
MSWLRLSEIAAMCGGRLHGEDATAQAVCIDSRAIKPGDVFIALQGPRFDAHEFVANLERSAAGAIVAQPQRATLPQIVVDDTQMALARLADRWRDRLQVRFIGLTGSNGKTTVKEMCAAILCRMGAVWATRGNLNNHIGVPLTLLSIRPHHDYAVVEMGANHPGEIAALTDLSRPDVGLVTNAGPAHLEGFGSVDGVARAKGELFEGMPTDAIAVINADDKYADLWRGFAGQREQVLFAMHGSADIRVHWLANQNRLQVGANGEQTEITLPLPGQHNAVNALAAAASCIAMGVGLEAVRAGLESVEPVTGRLETKSGRNGVFVLDDSYNANPGSLAVALDVLATHPGEHWLVLGDMAELGAEAEALHRHAGELARERGVDRLFTVGSLSRASARAFGKGATPYADADALLQALVPQLRPGVHLLVKGSRSMRMEKVVDALVADRAANDNAWGNNDAA